MRGSVLKKVASGWVHSARNTPIFLTAQQLLHRHRDVTLALLHDAMQGAALHARKQPTHQLRRTLLLGLALARVSCDVMESTGDTFASFQTTCVCVVAVL